MFKVLDFAKRWIRIMRNRLTPQKFAVLYKGIPNGYFESKNGIRQGDPLSPFLFTIIMEYFLVLME